MKFPQITTTILLATILLYSGCGEAEKTLLSKAQKKVDELQVQVNKAKEELNDIQEKQANFERQKKDEIDKLNPAITMQDRLPYMIKYCLEKSSPYSYGNEYFHLGEIEILESELLSVRGDDTSCIYSLGIRGLLSLREKNGKRTQRKSIDIKDEHARGCSFRFQVRAYNSNDECISELKSNPFHLNPTGQGGSFEVALPITDEYKKIPGTTQIKFPIIEEIHRIEISLSIWEYQLNSFGQRSWGYYETAPQVAVPDLLNPLKYYK